MEWDSWAHVLQVLKPVRPEPVLRNPEPVLRNPEPVLRNQGSRLSEKPAHRSEE